MVASSPITVVIAGVGSNRTLEASVRGFARELGREDRILVMDAVGDAPPDLRITGLHIVPSPKNALAPELWRDGLNQTTTPLVAFSTGQMEPRSGWLHAMRSALQKTGAAGVGGPIEPGAGISATDRGLYLLRYANYLPPVPESPTFDPPGDNAVYRRERLAGLESSWQDGFWEVEVHRHLRARGERLATAPEAVVTYLGAGSFGSSLSHRLEHARRYGAGRSRGCGWLSRIGRSAAFPAVPPLLLARIVANLNRRNEPMGPWLGALPSLGLLLATWSFGEAAGTLLGPGRSLSQAS